MAKIDDSVKKKVPELRFAGFADDWEQRKLKDIAQFNPKTKQPYKRGRNWAIIVYTDSAPEDWEDIIKKEPVVISPLHDKDVNPDGELTL